MTTMTITRILVQTNNHCDGFFTITLTQFGAGPFNAHMCSDKVEAFNAIHKDNLVTGKLIFINGEFFNIIAVDENELELEL